MMNKYLKNKESTHEDKKAEEVKENLRDLKATSSWIKHEDRTMGELLDYWRN